HSYVCTRRRELIVSFTTTYLSDYFTLVFNRHVVIQLLRSFPTRRSSDLNHSHCILRVIACELLEVTSHQEHLSLNHIPDSCSNFYPTSLMRLPNFRVFLMSFSFMIQRSRALTCA